MAGKDRLDRSERWILVAVCLFAAGGVLVALEVSFEASFQLFGERMSARERAVGNQALCVAAWATLTPFCVWMVLRGGKLAVAGASLWVATTVGCTWWRWPPAPDDWGDMLPEPLWRSGQSRAEWALVAVTLGVGVLAAWRSRRWLVRGVAASVVVALVGLAVWSQRQLDQHVASERPTAVDGGQHDLDVLAADRFWSQLPAARPETAHASPPFVAAWGERFGASVTHDFATSDPAGQFKQTIAVAGRVGWTMTHAFCSGSTWKATFEKALSVGHAMLDVEIGPYVVGVHVHGWLVESPLRLYPAKACWAPEPLVSRVEP